MFCFDITLINIILHIRNTAKKIRKFSILGLLWSKLLSKANSFFKSKLQVND